MKMEDFQKKAGKILSPLLAAVLFLGTLSTNVFEETISGNDSRIGAGTSANPVHHCTKKNDGTDYTDFSYVYFGSYPQSEVTDSAAIDAIENAIGTSGMAGSP